ncbi:MAG: DNA polymerase III subunit chi [Paracoccaceae bacterium]
MGQAMFYHLTRNPLQVTLGDLLDRSLDQGWNVVVRGRDAARLATLDALLWQGPQARFLPHGVAGGAQDADQPVLLTTGHDIPNGAVTLFSVDGADVTAAEVAQMQRVRILFDGNSDAAVQAARVQWKALTGAGCKAEYWSEESGKWQKKAKNERVAARC